MAMLNDSNIQVPATQVLFLVNQVLCLVSTVYGLINKFLMNLALLKKCGNSQLNELPTRSKLLGYALINLFRLPLANVV